MVRSRPGTPEGLLLIPVGRAAARLRALLLPPLAPPTLLRPLHSDEYRAPPLGPRDRRALAWAEALATRGAARLGSDPAAYRAGRTGTAAALLAIDRASEGGFYDVSELATRDPDAAHAALGGDELVIDVQTHYVAPERARRPAAAAILAFIRGVAPQRFAELEGDAALSLVEYLRCIFLESETAVAVLTSAPGEGEHNILTNAEIRATRLFVDRLAGSGRLLHHAIVHPNLPGELEAIEALHARHRPAGWKVYTLFGRSGAPGWRLDDRCGSAFLERSRQLGVRVVCAHKGFSQLAPTGSPADVGPAAAAFPELDLLVYHSGYEAPTGEAEEEGPYDAGSEAPRGVDRLVRSLAEAGIGPGANVYAELGSTWFCLLRRPREAAHVLGKLLRAVGEDRILWGTDSIWYGSPQPLIDAFRAFRIPEALCERHGYPPLTREVKAKILGANAARVYGRGRTGGAELGQSDYLAGTRAALAVARRGTPR